MLEQKSWEFGFALLGSYLLGAIPFGWLLAKLTSGVDLRKVGSGNIGATNVGRALGRGALVLVYLLDFGKGLAPTRWFPILFGLDSMGNTVPVLLGAAAVLGHCFPIYLRFRGGKGVATTTGVFLGLDYLAFSLAAGIWLITLGLFRYVSVASLVLVFSLPFFLYFMAPSLAFTERMPILILSIFTALFIVYTHRSNIRRLMKGEEPKIRGFSSSTPKGSERT